MAAKPNHLRHALPLLAFLLPATAQAHAHLQSATPADGATVQAAPEDIVLQFSEGIEPALSRVSITGPDGKAVATTIKVDAGDPSRLHIVPAQPLQAGGQTLAWRLVSADTHRVQGSLRFEIAGGPAAKVGKISILEPHALATAPHQPTGAAYMTIVNDGETPDRLIAVATNVAKSASLHRSAADDAGVMTMGPLEDGLEIPAHGRAELAPGGVHVMLEGLAAGLKAGQVLTIELTFAQAGRTTLLVPVQALGGGRSAMQSGMPTQPGTP
ncbi:Copper(I)-binding protein [Arboricoccus pini]|uniref:Copper(I)-binding protein n=1 Tax=Arboricoccus pini TaxID=1963835 RepID=A0A212RWX2_9PROT|nr:copper homeostasis periplasmic binding protein CopC [Arboricoccus pini]SNB77289.1 Copper(I)-binding protein [Arboricoccus pini]